LGFEDGLGRAGLRGAAAALVFRLFLVADRLGFVAVGAKLASDGFFHGQYGVVKVPFGLTGGIGGGFEQGGEFGFFLSLGQHGLVGGFKPYGGGFAADGDVIFDGTEPVIGHDIGADGFGGETTGNVDTKELTRQSK
jgi:hypothetical protein